MIATKNIFKSLVAVAACLFLVTGTVVNTGCNDAPVITDTGSVNTPKVPRVPSPAFNADSAYKYIEAQVAFGPRVPGTPGHAACANYITEKLKSFGLAVTVQEAPATLYTGRAITMKNIMAQYKPERTDRVLLVAHWDTRHIADRDTDTSFMSKPIDGANDGGSGVAVLLEIARVIGEKDPNIGVDFLFVDAEDHGQPGGSNESWCLGSQYWAQNVKSDYVKTVRYGILLDMVGAKGAVFPREGTSMYYASNVVQKVWSSAANLGYGHMFVNSVTGQTIDDNLFISKKAGLPCIDIVHYDPAEQDYGPTHHRHTDNMDNIDTATLGAVGKVVLDVIYNEKVK
ncbi:MAG TPA: M28 family peptidase [Bacteroidia bacterium]|nr:M28 family peptidase [Bacteroidia bacterium]